MQEALIWFLIIELIGLAALPLALAVFRWLPDRGYTLAKPLGLLAAAYVVWLVSMMGLPFNAAVSWLAGGGLLLGLSGGVLLAGGGRWRAEIMRFGREHRGFIVLVEIIFGLAYVYLVNLRSYMPDIRDQEKFGDFAFMNSLVLFDKMPPADPWMSGYPVNYYYFSHFMMAMLTKMTGIDPAIAFNLTIPLVFALTAVGCLGVVYNLVAARGEVARRRVAIFFGLLGLLMVCMLGNLDPVRQIFFPRPAVGETGPGNFAFSWWTPSRVIHDYMPVPGYDGAISYVWRETINEFPMFSFLLADMHPHVMTLPFVIVVIGLAFNILRVPAGSEDFNLRRAAGWRLLAVSAVATGSLYFLNTWDYPTYLLVLLGAVLLRQRMIAASGAGGKPEGWWSRARPAALWGGLLVVGSLALYLPFHLTFISLLGDNFVPEPVASIPVLNSIARTISFVAWDRTPLLGYLLVFGIFVFPLLSFLLLKLWPYLSQPYAYVEAEPGRWRNSKSGAISDTSYYVAGLGLVLLLVSQVSFYVLRANPVLTTLLGLLGAPVVAVGLAMIVREMLPWWRARQARTELLAITGGLAALTVGAGWLLHFELYGPLVITGVFTALLLWFESRAIADHPEEAPPVEAQGDHRLLLPDLLVLLLLLLPVVISFGTELVLIRDIFNMRLNTLFKFYYQAWVMYGLGAAYATWRIVDWAWKLNPAERAESRQRPEPEPGRAASGLAGATRPLTQLRLSPVAGLAAGSGGAGLLAFRAGLPPSAQPYSGPARPQVNPEEGPLLPADALPDDPEAEEAEDYALTGQTRPWWRWLWVLGMGVLVAAGMIYPIFGPYEKTGRYEQRIGLDGANWLREGGRTGGPMPQDYQAIQWLKSRLAADRSFNGVILEASGPDWVDYSRVSTFSGMPTLLGWIGHEDQWRGGKALARKDVFDCGQLLAKYNLRAPQSGPSLQKDEPRCRLQLVDLIYSTTDTALAQDLLRAAGVRYVYVGSLETGLNNGRWGEAKQYPPQALLKFGQFMKPVYQQNGVVIYSFD